MMESLISFAGGLKAASDITKALFDLKLTGDVQSKVIDLQSIIMSAQSDAMAAQQESFAMVAKVQELEAKIAQLEGIGGLREKYVLTDVHEGAFAYTLKPEASEGETPHWLCVNCFGAGYASVLQNWGRVGAHTDCIHGCPRCQTKIVVHMSIHPSRG